MNQKKILFNIHYVLWGFDCQNRGHNCEFWKASLPSRLRHSKILILFKCRKSTRVLRKAPDFWYKVMCRKTLKIVRSNLGCCFSRNYVSSAATVEQSIETIYWSLSVCRSDCFSGAVENDSIFYNTESGWRA